MVLDVINRDQLPAPKKITLCALAGAALLAVVAATPVPRSIFQKFSSGCFLEEIEVCIPQKVSPSVVSIKTPFGNGSGVILDDGLLATNAHVVVGVGTQAVEVKLSDNRVFTGKVVAHDPTGSDLALLAIENPPPDLKPFKLSSSETFKVGQTVIAIGNPFDRGHAVSQGSISQLHSSDGYIQLDISLNPGNSGGALVDTNGRLIGINTAIIDQGNGNTGIGLAIPVENVIAFLTKYKNGEVTAPPPISPEMVELNGFPIQGKISFAQSIPLEDGSLCNLYEFVGSAGDNIEIVMTSTGEIDPYLIMTTPNGELVEDDDSAGNLNAFISGKLGMSGVYTICANTAGAGQIGNYTLRLSR